MRNYLFLIFIVILMINASLITYLFDTPIKLWKWKKPVINIIVEDLNEQEIYQVSKVMMEVKPIYLTDIKKVTFLKKINESWIKETKFPLKTSLNGYNYNYSAYVRYIQNYSLLKEVICHELLHSYSQSKNQSTEETIVTQLGKMGVCYE